LLATLYFSSLFFFGNVSAAQITNRSLTLQANGSDGPDADTIPDGPSEPAGLSNHFFKFTVPTAGNIGSIKFEYCTTPSGPSNPACTHPAGVSTTGGGVTLDETGSAATGFTLNNTTNGAPYITRTAASVSANAVLQFKLSGVTNPDGTSCGGSAPQNNNCTFYVRITTYDAAALGGSAVDTGTVAASTAQQIVLSGYMPESLIFCTGGTVSTTSGVPDCSTATSGVISFNQSFSPSDTAWAVSQMAASTNANSGYTITYSGPTLTSGSNTVSPMTSATTSTRGLSQFGLNLVANDGSAYANAPNVTGSADLAPASSGTHQGKVTASYNAGGTHNGTFKFTTSGDVLANSDFSGSAGPSDSQIYTVSYIVNANGAQPVGTYTTTLTYVCTATF